VEAAKLTEVQQSGGGGGGRSFIHSFLPSFVPALFNDAVSNSEGIASNDGVFNEK
jgi:hypothetical protein